MPGHHRPELNLEHARAAWTCAQPFDKVISPSTGGTGAGIC